MRAGLRVVANNKQWKESSADCIDGGRSSALIRLGRKHQSAARQTGHASQMYPHYVALDHQRELGVEDSLGEPDPAILATTTLLLILASIAANTGVGSNINMAMESIYNLPASNELFACHVTLFP